MPLLLVIGAAAVALYLWANKASKFPGSNPQPSPQPLPSPTPYSGVIIVGPTGVHGGDSVSANVGDAMALVGIGDAWSNTNPNGWAVYASPGILQDWGGGSMSFVAPGSVHIAWPGDEAYIQVYGKK
jgi:hypothetical protein